jgi:hypothetical protein
MITQTLKDGEGQWSSKRVNAFLCTLAAILFGYMGKDTTVVIAFLTASGGLGVGGTLAEKVGAKGVQTPNK